MVSKIEVPILGDVRVLLVNVCVPSVETSPAPSAPEYIKLTPIPSVFEKEPFETIWVTGILVYPLASVTAPFTL